MAPLTTPLPPLAGRRRPNPFRVPRPSTEWQPGSWAGDMTVHRRTPDQVAEVMHRRVSAWFYAAFDAVPAEASREERIACTFGIRGWETKATIATVYDNKRPSHGWLLTHPTDGALVFVDKARDGDLGPDYVAPTGGPWGGLSRLTWASDLTALITARVAPTPTVSRLPLNRTTSALLVAGYRLASSTEQDAIRFLVALSGGDLPAWLALHENPDPAPPSPERRLP